MQKEVLKILKMQRKSKPQEATKSKKELKKNIVIRSSIKVYNMSQNNYLYSILKLREKSKIMYKLKHFYSIVDQYIIV